MQTDQYLLAESTIDQDILEECLKGMNIEPPTGTATISPHHFPLHCATVLSVHKCILGTFLEIVIQFLQLFYRGHHCL